ncbi:hypothetical protein FA15DRAFT_653735 [Coprinopsis marcescibilis]|uniref:Uncharacterized protein n=1 Tax=Coprinopsis marcescibilis TaxID=230819 RepID=A0A5C3L556_COPMA|nr:hypothetical protein FA15DRAFT_653735 [Coprinopsis marcescibilis]
MKLTAITTLLFLIAGVLGQDPSAPVNSTPSETPDATGVPGATDVPETPGASNTPDVPETPGGSGAPGVPGGSAIPSGSVPGGGASISGPPRPTGGDDDSTLTPNNPPANQGSGSAGIIQLPTINPDLCYLA